MNVTNTRICICIYAYTYIPEYVHQIDHSHTYLSFEHEVCTSQTFNRRITLAMGKNGNKAR